MKFHSRLLAIAAAAIGCAPADDEGMKAVRVLIPDESFALVNFKQDGLPGVMILNKALAGLDGREAFAWHLSIMIQLDDLIDKGMPSEAERAVVDPFGHSLGDTFVGDNAAKPNALFLARITWNGTRELIYRVYDPEPINSFLQGLIESKTHARAFDYRIDPDQDWELTRWHLGTLTAQPDDATDRATPDR